jgi:dTDP-4-dehydrorhamnose reductase
MTGSSGQVGSALRALAPAGATICAFSHAELDIGDAGAVQQAVEQSKPSLIINAAAYTAVDLAESQPERARAVNALGPRYLAQAAASLKCRLLHVSTDYVFDGTATVPYAPADATHPLSVYGQTKLQGEQYVFELLPLNAAVVRTAWVYAPQGQNFVLTMLRLMRERGVVRVVADQLGCPTAAQSVATVLWRLAELPQLHGVFHWTDAGIVSWYDFARAIAEEAVEQRLLRELPQVTPITTAEYPTAAPRPRLSALDSSETARRLGLQPAPWRSNLRTVIRNVADRERAVSS